MLFNKLRELLNLFHKAEPKVVPDKEVEQKKIKQIDELNESQIEKESGIQKTIGEQSIDKRLTPSGASIRSNKNYLDGTCISEWLTDKNIYEIQRALGKPIDSDTLKMLVQKDGPKVACSICRKIFQPVKVVTIKEALSHIKKHGGKLVSNEIKYETGSHLIVYKNGLVLKPLCGGLFKFDTTGNQVLNIETCLYEGYISVENKDKEKDKQRPVRARECLDRILNR